MRAAEEGKKDITKAWDGGGREEGHNESLGWRRKGRRTQRKFGMREWDGCRNRRGKYKKDHILSAEERCKEDLERGSGETGGEKCASLRLDASFQGGAGAAERAVEAGGAFRLLQHRGSRL